MDFHRFDEDSAYRSTFRGVVMHDNKPYMAGPMGLIPVTIRSVEMYRRNYADAFNQGYHDLDGVLSNITETAYWDAVKAVKTLEADGYGYLIPEIPTRENDDVL
jgi:hypothetical protein